MRQNSVLTEFEEKTTESGPASGTANYPGKPAWLVTATSFAFILLQSACSAVIAISGIRVAIGLSSLAAATVGIRGPASGFHQDVIRIPMMVLAIIGSVINLYVIWRIRSLRARPSSRWRAQDPTREQKRSETIQIALSILTLILVSAEWLAHHIVHRG